ncbi:MAG: four helix bundle protein [Gemmatimonadota bacterium]
MQVLDHEKLEVYQVARELSREVYRLIKKARNKHQRADLVDQTNRAVASLPLNIAEGSGEASVGRKAYFYRIARGSATELSAALDHMVDMEMLDDMDTRVAKTLTVRVVAMLVKLTGSVNTPESFPSLPGRRQGRKR